MQCLVFGEDLDCRETASHLRVQPARVDKWSFFFIIISTKKVINYKYANFSHGRLYVCVSIHLLLPIPVVRRGLSSRSLFSLQPRQSVSFLVFSYYAPSTLRPLSSLRCQASAQWKHASFFTSLGVLISTKRLLGNSPGACSLAWTSLTSDCSLFLVWRRRSGDGFARQMQLCVWEGVKWHKKAVSVSRWDGESQHYAHVKSIKNKSLACRKYWLYAAEIASQFFKKDIYKYHNWEKVDLD